MVNASAGFLTVRRWISSSLKPRRFERRQEIFEQRGIGTELPSAGLADRVPSGVLRDEDAA